jgi:hypothetical protein
MPAECYTCAEWGCSDEDGNPISFMEGNERKCACDCHSWLDKVSEAADEIERLRYEITQANNAIKLLIEIETAGRQEDVNGPR